MYKKCLCIKGNLPPLYIIEGGFGETDKTCVACGANSGIFVCFQYLFELLKWRATWGDGRICFLPNFEFLKKVAFVLYCHIFCIGFRS